MTAELMIMHGQQAGQSIPLQQRETLLGKDPSSQFVLQEPGAGWRHCIIREENGRYRLSDFQAGEGTFVNGVRVREHWLTPGDQIRIGSTILAFRTDDSVRVGADISRQTLLRASAILYMVKSIANTHDAARRYQLGMQVVALLQDVMPCKDGALYISREQASLHQQAALFLRVWETGTPDTQGDWYAAPMTVRGVVQGVIAAEAAGSASHVQESLAAMVTLITPALESIREVETLRNEKEILREQLDLEHPIVGKSGAIERLLTMVDRVAPRDTTVLILGESGTGKELVARAVHERSTRNSAPFVAINCAALTETLLESELFGHEKGSFTGAVAQKRGKLELAEGGTVFLDEIGEMALALQAKMLRVLQQREFERVGGTRTQRLDIRLIAATNRDLAGEVKKGVFREDLYHRLNVVALRTPPLRDRKDDIPLLAGHFLKKSAAACSRRVAGISPEAEQCLVAYGWPGNVRELENAIERAVVLGDSDTLLPEDLPEALLEAGPAVDLAGAYYSSVGGAKREAIVKAWEQAKGDYKGAAQLLGIHPNSLLRLVRNLGLRDQLK
ncbi:MAG: sigma 54-interacting transcriptional regulator [Acidobacteria bacterium]|nr:sigma 54-interacting transcriptional regulator [Acidobacteriota bacterium]